MRARERRRLILALAALAGLLELPGCTGSPSADVIKALAGDPNSICFTVTTIYGSSMFDRNHGCPQNSAPAGVVVVTPGGPTPFHVERIQ